MSTPAPAVVDTPTGPLWCEGFDGDLYALLPMMAAPLIVLALIDRLEIDRTPEPDRP